VAEKDAAPRIRDHLRAVKVGEAVEERLRSLREKAVVEVLLQPWRVRAAVKTLLVVEDDPDIQEYCRLLLAGLGARVVVASDGREALAVIDAGGPVDLILLDVILPGMGGEEFLRELRLRRGLGVPVVVCSVEERLVEPLRRVGEIQGVFRKGDPGSALLALVRARLGSAPGPAGGAQPASATGA